MPPYFMTTGMMCNAQLPCHLVTTWDKRPEHALPVAEANQPEDTE